MTIRIPPDSVRARLKKEGTSLPVIAALRDARVRANIPQRTLAQRIGATPRQLVRWEMGEAQPGAFVLTCWAEALGLSIQLVPLGLRD